MLRAMLRPMPLLAPVTTARFPASGKDSCSAIVVYPFQVARRTRCQFSCVI